MNIADKLEFLRVNRMRRALSRREMEIPGEAFCAYGKRYGPQWHGFVGHCAVFVLGRSCELSKLKVES